MRALLWHGSELTRSAGSFCVRSLGTEPASRHRLRAQDRSADAVGVTIAGHRLQVRAPDRSAHALGVPPTDAGEALSPLIEPSRVALDRMRDRSTHEPRSGVQPEAGVIHSVNPGPERARGVP